jgi:hypothetical protein
MQIEQILFNTFQTEEAQRHEEEVKRQAAEKDEMERKRKEREVCEVEFRKLPLYHHVFVFAHVNNA